MSEACCYCGGELSDSFAVSRGFHGYCNNGFDPGRYIAAYAALAAAHDESVAEWERREESAAVYLDCVKSERDGYWRDVQAGEALLWRAQEDAGSWRRTAERLQERAESAEAQLAERDAVIRRGIYALMGLRFAALERAANVWERRALAAEAQLATAEAAGARAFALSVPWHATEAEKRLADWQAAQETKQ